MGGKKDAEKLTLHLDRDVVEAAEKVAARENVTLSQLIEDHLRQIAEPEVGYASEGERQPADEVEPTDEPDWKKDLPPITRSLVGILKGEEVDEEEYGRYLEDKHR